MPWNWELPEWPNFIYDFSRISQQEKQFLLEIGSGTAFLKTIAEEERHQFIVEMLSSEGLESSKIEGELLDRKSLQSSIKCCFGIQIDHKKEEKKRQESQSFYVMFMKLTTHL